MLKVVAAEAYLPEVSVAVPVGVVPDPITAIVTGTAVLLTIDFVAGVTVTVGLPLVLAEPPPPLVCEGEDEEPQPTPVKTKAAASMEQHSIALHL